MAEVISDTSPIPLGILLRAKQAGRIHVVRPTLDHLDALGFRLDRQTRAVVLSLAGEYP